MNEQTTKGGVFTFMHPSGTTCVILTEHPRFEPGELLSSIEADSTLDFADVCLGIGRHLGGDWGTVSAGLWRSNERALMENGLLLSTHSDRRGNDFVVFTLADRSQTWVILVEECQRLNEERKERQLC